MQNRNISDLGFEKEKNLDRSYSCGQKFRDATGRVDAKVH